MSFFPCDSFCDSIGEKFGEKRSFLFHLLFNILSGSIQAVIDDVLLVNQIERLISYSFGLNLLNLKFKMNN